MGGAKSGKARNYGTLKFNGADAEKRLGELMLHIANKCEDDPTFGATKLNKILWWADFISYARTGRPITGVEYHRLGNGPAPKRLLPVRKKLIAKKDAVVKERPIYNRTQIRLIPLREAKYDLFTAEQIALVDEIISGLWEEPAKYISELSHGKAWEVAKDGQSMPYESIFLSDSPITRFDVIRTLELAEQYGWDRI